MKLTQNNYYSSKANKEYMSVSQYKMFFGTLKNKGCEAQAIARLNGEYVTEPTKDMLIGSYVDSYFEGTLEKFKERTPQIFNSRTGELKAEFKGADDIISRIEKDKKFLQYLSGEKQTIMTAEFLGVNWKIKMDSYLPDKGIVDLKVVKDIHEPIYCPDIGKVNFIQAAGYDFQLAIYQKVVELNTGKLLNCYIAAADKGSVTNIEIIQITQPELESSLLGIKQGIERIKQIKSGEIKPERCERCNYCKETKVITTPVLMSSLI